MITTYTLHTHFCLFLYLRVFRWLEKHVVTRLFVRIPFCDVLISVIFPNTQTNFCQKRYLNEHSSFLLMVPVDLLFDHFNRKSLEK